MISASNKLQKKETRESRKLFQPPQLGSSSLLSSQELQQERFHGLSNVQEKSVLSSQNQNLDKRDIEEFIANMKMAEQYSEPLSPISHKPNPSRVRRIEAQNIVVQQDQIGSNSIGKESVILQHIDFNQEEKHQPQITPEWENHHNNYKHQGVNYTINYVQAAHNFLVQENQNISSQTPFDFTNSELKNPQVRHSKNTCVQHIDLGDSNHINHFKQKNKSCIAPPANSQSNCQAQSSNQQDINHILKKWNNFIYPELSEEYLRKDVRQEKGNKKNIAYNLPTQGKSCVSNYEGIMQGEDFSDYKSTNKFKEEDKQTNTKQKSVDLKLKQYNDRIRQLEDKLKKKDDQNSRLFISQKKKQEELVYLRQKLKKKSEEILSLRYTVQPANQSANKQWYEECKRMESKNKELESIINEKNMTIRIYQEKLNVLQKKLYETVMNVQKNILTQQITTQASSVRMPQFDTFSQLSPRNSMQVNTHEVCNAKIEALQEYIFDMQQQRVGIDLQVQKRLKAVTQKIESQVRRNANEEFRVILLNLKEDNSKLRQINNQINLQRKEVIQQYQRKQAVILEREEKVKHMYEQLVSQWDQHEKIKEKSFQKKNNFASTITNPLLSSPRSANLYQTSFSKNQTSQLHSRFNSPPKGNNLLNKNFFSPTNPKSTINVTNYERDSSINYFKDYQTLLPSLRSNTINAIDNSIGFERMSFERESNNKSKEMGQSFGENCDLYIINSKIQKLRSEINRELDLIH